MKNKNLKKYLKKYLSLSLGAANVLLPIAIATVTDSLMVSPVNAGICSESEDDEEFVGECPYTYLRLPSWVLLKLDNGKAHISSTLSFMNCFELRDFANESVRVRRNGRGGANFILLDSNGARYEYVKKQAFVKLNEDTYARVNFANCTFSVYIGRFTDGVITIGGVPFVKAQ